MLDYFEVVYVGACLRVGSGHGLVVRVLDLGFLCSGFDPHRAWFAYEV